MRFLKVPWRIGAAAGFLVALFVFLGVQFGLQEDGAIGDAIAYLGATPVMAFDLLRDADPAIQWSALFAWWMLTGAALGWAAGQEKGGFVFALILLLAVIAGHSETRFGLEQRMDDAAREIERSIWEMLR